MSDRIRILFVDDDARLLSGLVRLFRPRRDVWDVATAGGASEALTWIASHPVDVVVSDMRMPGMDGAALLMQVADLHPQVVRIILSGQCDRESIISRVGPCHHFLNKPCDPATLASLVDRSCALRRFLADPIHTASLARRDDLPALPQLYQRIVAELQSQDPSLNRLTDLIEQDLGMASHLLKTVNSASFGLPHRVGSIAEAVALAGIEILRALVLAVHVFDACHDGGRAGLDIERLWAHSVAVGRLARGILAEAKAPVEVCEAAFTAGLLHDIGQLLVASGDPSGYRTAVLGRPAHLSLPEGEARALGLRHDVAGAWLLMRWGLPDAIVEAVAWHHEPSRGGCAGLDVLAAVHLADVIIADEPPTPAVPDPTLLECLGGADRMEGWRQLAQQVRP